MILWGKKLVVIRAVEVTVMDLKVSGGTEGRRCTPAQLLFIIYVLLVESLTTEGIQCMKREEIGNREGNLYQCNDIILTECCERNRTFTCCEPAWKHNIRDQLWLLFAVVIMACIMCLLVSWCSGQSEFFRSPTAKDAARNWKDKFVDTFDSVRGQKSGSVGGAINSKPNYKPMSSSCQSLGPVHDLA